MSRFITRYFYSPLSGTRTVNLDDYSKKLQDMYEEFDKHGYDVINVIPVSMGSSEEMQKHAMYTGTATFSLTMGAMIVGKKRE